MIPLVNENNLFDITEVKYTASWTITITLEKLDGKPMAQV